MLAGCLKLLLAESVTEVILTWVSHAAVQPTINQSRHGCKPKPENIRSNSKSLPTLATIVVEKLRRGSGLLEQWVAHGALSRAGFDVVLFVRAR